MTKKILGTHVKREWDDINFENLSPYNIKTLNDLNKISPYPDHMQYIKDLKSKTGYPTDQNIDWKLSIIHETERKNWQGDPWSYQINKYGFRDVWQTKAKRKNMGFFGCSMTFGEGVDTPNLWTTILAKKLKMNKFNFGMGGTSVSRIARTFVCVQQVLNLDYAVVLFPHSYRTEYAIKESRKAPTLHIANLVPNRADPQLIDMHKGIFSVMNDNIAGLEVLRAATMIHESAKAHGTKVIFSSWDHFTWTVLHQMNIPNLCEYVYKMQYQDHDYARDDGHPGPKANATWADTLYDWVQENSFIER